MLFKIDEETVIMTCAACPSLWEGFLIDGRRFYARYRRGHFTFYIYEEGEDSDEYNTPVISLEYGEVWCGVMETETMYDIVRTSILYTLKRLEYKFFVNINND